MAALEKLAAACTARPASDEDSVDGVRPQMVVTPSTLDETATALQVASEHGLAVVARGNGTKLTWGAPPTQVDLVVDMSAMDRVVEHAAGDLIVIAEAGTPLRTLAERLSTAGQRLALDEMVPGTTVGGAVATSPSGPRRMSTGTVRDHLIGVTMVRADGVVAKAGGKVVKNVAGYDLGKLLTGSYGTLGIVTQAIFRLHPVPPASRWVRRRVGSADDLRAATRSVLGSQTVPAAVEVDWAAGDDAGEVLVEVAGTDAGTRERAQTVAGLLGAGAEELGEPPTWFARYPWADPGVALKLTCQLSGVADVVDAARSVDVPVDIRGSAGVGVLFAAMSAATDPRDVRRVVERLRAVCGARGGSVVVVDAPAQVKEAVDVWGPVQGLDLMRRVKAEFDPDHRLAPGRFVGGI